VLPTGYSRSFLSDLYDPKTLLWIRDGHLATPDEDELVVLKPGEVDEALAVQEELTPRKD
jgi:hypothetical protein